MRLFTRYGGPRLLNQVENASSVIQETPAGWRQAQATLLADKQIHTQVLLELLDSGREVRWHPVDMLGGNADAAVLGDSLENFELDQIQVILQT
ncbi:hypothetical protein D3C76_1016570 [compost metagenome]